VKILHLIVMEIELCPSLFLTLELPAILKIMRAVFDYFTSYTEVINLRHDLIWSYM